MNATNQYTTANGQIINANPATEWELRNLRGIIYVFYNKVNKKVYVGQTINTFYRRYGVSYECWSGYYCKNSHFKNAIKCHKRNDWEIFILDFYLTYPLIDFIETISINKFNSTDNTYGYNIEKGGNHWHKGREKFYKTFDTKRMGFCQNFILKSIATHGNKYDYSHVNYVNTSTPVLIYCKVCNRLFSQIPDAHSGKQKQGCPNCRYKRLSETCKNKIDIFELRLKNKFGDAFIFKKSTFNGLNKRIEFTHTECGTKFVKSGTKMLLQKHGCPLCSDKNANVYKRSVYKLNPDTLEIIQEYKSAKDACRDTGIDWIYDCISRGIKGAGYRWQYVDKYSEIKCNNMLRTTTNKKL